MCFAYMISFTPHQQFYKTGISSTFELRKRQRLREAEQLARGHTADKQWRQNSHPGLQPSEYLVSRECSLW